MVSRSKYSSKMHTYFPVNTPDTSTRITSYSSPLKYSVTSIANPSRMFYTASFDQSSHAQSPQCGTNVPLLLTETALSLGSNPSPFNYHQDFENVCTAQMQHHMTPVMHPNLVYTLRSIISPQQRQGSGDLVSSMKESTECDLFLQFGNFELPECPDVRTAEQGACCDTTFGSPSWPSPRDIKQVNNCGRSESPQAVLVPLDLIQNRRPYHCAFAGCLKTFKNPQTMKMHHKTHFRGTSASWLGAEAISAVMPGSGFKAGPNKKIPSGCPSCKKTFVGLYELRRHFGRKHSEGEKSCGCRKCGKKFHIEVDVRDHEKLCGEAIVCKCGMKFAFKCNLVAHKRAHQECQDRVAMEEQRGTNEQHGSPPGIHRKEGKRGPVD